MSLFVKAEGGPGRPTGRQWTDSSLSATQLTGAVSSSPYSTYDLLVTITFSNQMISLQALRGASYSIDVLEFR